MSIVALDALPQHVAIIMDGNGRWAKLLGKTRSAGHREGSEAVRRVVRACRRLGIRALTLYAFGEQNWHRPATEIRSLMELFREFLIRERPEVLRTGIRFKAIGRIYRLPKPIQILIKQLERDTRHLNGMVLQLAVSYGGQEEIADTAKRIAQLAYRREIDPEEISESFFRDSLPSLRVGPVDLLIRTGGEYRISNFLLWGAAYAELYFCQTLWPDFDEELLYKAISFFQKRERRFGRVRAEDGTLNDRSFPSPTFDTFTDI
jgi:undecaprenyl diphosphate synthase